jgi:hypothetical protein
MAIKVTCRYCKEEFVPAPGKPGYIDECPDCLREKIEALKSKPKSDLQKFWEYVAAHPVTINVKDGLPVLHKTRCELVAKLMRLNARYGSRLSEDTIRRIVDAYMATVEEGPSAVTGDKPDPDNGTVLNQV